MQLITTKKLTLVLGNWHVPSSFVYEVRYIHSSTATALTRQGGRDRALPLSLQRTKTSPERSVNEP